MFRVYRKEALKHDDKDLEAHDNKLTGQILDHEFLKSFSH